MTCNAGTLNLSGTVANLVVGGGSTINLNSGAQINTPVFSAGGVSTLNVNSGASVTGDIITQFSVSDVNINLADNVTGNVLIDDGSILGLRGGSIGGNLSSGFDSISNIAWNLSNPITVTGNLTTLGTQTVSVLNNPTPGSPATVLTYGGTFTGSIADFVLADAVNYRSVLFQDTGTAITVSTGSGTRTWVGADATNPTFWDTETTNWAEGDNSFFNGDAVVFDDSATGTTVALQGLFVPQSIDINNTTKDYSFTGTGGHGFVGTTGITKNGTGSVTLSGFSHSYTGPVVINAGTLVAGSNETLGLTSGLTVNEGARFNIDGYSLGAGVRAYSVTIAGVGDGTGAITNTGNDVASNAGFRNLTLSADATIGGTGRYDIGLANGVGSGTINGNGHTLTVTGTNQITMRGPATDVTYAVDQGSLIFEDVDTSSGNNLITVNGGTVGSWGARTIINDVLLAAGTSFGSVGGGAASWTGTITTDGAATLLTNSNLTLNGALAGDATITRSGGNTLFLENTGAAFTGKIISASGGTLRIASSAALGTATGADVLTLGGGVNLQGGTTTLHDSITIGSATQGITHTGNVTYNPGADNTLTLDGAITGLAEGVMEKPSNSGSIVFNRNVNIPGSVNGNGGSITFNGDLVLGSIPSSYRTGSGLANNLNSPNLNLAGGMQFWLGTTNINIGTGTTTYFRMQEGSNNPHTVNHTAGDLTVTGDVRLGHWGGAVANVYNISGGSLNQPDTVTAPTNESQANLFIGIDGIGNLNISDTGKVNTTSLVVNGRGGTTSDTVNLTGGSLNIGRWGIRNPGTAFVNLGGGTLGAWAANWTSSTPMSLTGINGDVTINTLDSVDGTTPRTITLTGVLSGSGGLLKQGSGNLVLSNPAGTFTGTAEVGEGSLFLNSSAALAATVRTSSGGTLRLGTPSTTGTALVESLDMDGGVTTFRVGTTKDLLDANLFDVSSASTISIIPTSALTAGEKYDLIAYGGTIDGLGSAGITLNPIANPHYSAALDTTEDGFIKLDILSADTITWTGATNGLWDTDTTFNWQTDSDNAVSKFFGFDVVRFDDTGSNTIITLAGTINPASVEVDAALNYSFDGSGISGSTGLVKSGTGILSLLNNNTYLGAVSITGGDLVVGNGGTVGTLGGEGNVTLSDANLTFDRSDAQTFPRTIAGTNGTFFKNGPGTLTMNAGNHTCDIVINSGILAARGGGWSTSFAANRTVTVNAPGVLDTTTHALGGLGGATRPSNIVINEDGIWKLNNEQQLPTTATTMTAGVINGPGQIRGGGTLATLALATKSSVVNAPINNGNGAVTFNVADGDVAIDLDVTATIIGGNAITKSGEGTMRSTADNTYTGTTNINAGVLQLGAGGTTGTLGTGAVVNNASLVIDRSNDLTVSNAISGSGSLTKGGGINVLTLTAQNTYSGDTLVNAGTMVLASEGGMRFVPASNGDSNQITGSGGVELSGTFTIDLTGADLSNGNSWTLVDVGSLSSEVFLSSFAVAGFTETANVHTLEDANNTWTFSEATGVLSLTVVGGFDSWAAANISDPAKRNRADDADNDGFTNLQEFLFGMDPDVRNGSLTTTEQSGGNLIIRWRERTEGAVYTLLETTTLDNPWETSAAPITTDGALDGDYQPVKATAIIGADKDFFRVKGEEN